MVDNVTEGPFLNSTLGPYTYNDKRKCETQKQAWEIW
jgi:hypothetical protein